MTVSRSCRPAPPAHEQAGRGEGHDKQGGAAWAGLRGDGARAGGGGLVGWVPHPLPPSSRWGVLYDEVSPPKRWSRRRAATGSRTPTLGGCWATKGASPAAVTSVR